MIDKQLSLVNPRGSFTLDALRCGAAAARCVVFLPHMPQYAAHNYTATYCIYTLTYVYSTQDNARRRMNRNATQRNASGVSKDLVI